MAIHYHGTPITPAAQLARMGGEHFCVSFANPQNADVCEQIAQSVLWDNGAFSFRERPNPLDERALYEWLESRLYHPHRAVVLDKIPMPGQHGTSVDDQRAMVRRWPFPRDLSWPVWHLDKPFDYLLELADEWPGVCLGSAGKYWEVGSVTWERRMEAVLEYVSQRRTRMPWLHGLRMLGQIGAWPLASADSTNVAQNHGRDTGCAYCKARRLNRVNPLRLSAVKMAGDLFAAEG